MARYFGGFRDRLKKRSKNLPLSEKEIDWVKVATTFSWSPARRDYQWLDPEDYLSSFLNSGEESPFDLSDESRGDGSMDVVGNGAVTDDMYSEFELIEESFILQDGTAADNKIQYEPPFDFEPQVPNNEDDDDHAEASGHILRPNIDVPAELPLLDEYRLELLSALQRRGVRLTVDKISLPDDLERDLITYHNGNASIDSYELRARLQSFKKQVIESYESFNSVAGNVRVPDFSEIAKTTAIDVESPAEETEEDYESFILKSLNRLEASMQDEDVPVEDTPVARAPEPIEPASPARATGDEPSIRSTRESDTPLNAELQSRDALRDDDIPQYTPIPEPPSSFADDSWLVLPIDPTPAESDEVDTNANDEYPAERVNGSENGIDDTAPDEAALEDPSLAYSADLLKALNTMSSRFPEEIFEEEDEEDVQSGEDTLTFLRGREGATLELTTNADVAEDENEVFSDPVDPEPDIEFTHSEEDDESSVLEYLGAIDEEEPEDVEAIDSTDEPAADTHSPSYIHQQLQNLGANKSTAPEPEKDDIKASLTEDETSLSDLLLQLRNDSSKSAPNTNDEHTGHTEIAQPELPPQPAEEESQIEEAPQAVEEEPEMIHVEKIEEPADFLEPEPEQEKEEPVVSEAEKEESPVTVSEKDERQRYIEEERKKLFSILNKLENKDLRSIEEAAEVNEEPPQVDIDQTAESKSTEVVEEVVEEPIEVVEQVVLEPAIEPEIEAVADQPTSEADADEDRVSDALRAIIERTTVAADPVEENISSNANIREIKLEAEQPIEDEPKPLVVEQKTVEPPQVESAEEQEDESPQPLESMFDLASDLNTDTEPLNLSEDIAPPVPAETVRMEEPVDVFAEETSSEEIVPEPDLNIDELSQPQGGSIEHVEAKESEAVTPEVTPDVKEELSVTTNPEADQAEPVVEETEKKEVASEVVEEEVKDEELSEADEAMPQLASLENVLEAIAFATEEPIPLKKVGSIFAELQGEKMPNEKRLMKAIETLNEHYEETDRAFRIKLWGGGVRMVSHPGYARFIRALYEDHRPKKLSRTLMETLAIIAYSQPSTKPEVDFVRGVDSDYAVRKLLELGLIDIVGRSDAIGRPLLYGTSERFLEQFGLSQLEALPKLREVEELLGDPAFKKERLHLLALEGIDEAVSAAKEDTEAAESEAVEAIETPEPPKADGEAESTPSA